MGNSSKFRIQLESMIRDCIPWVYRPMIKMHRRKIRVSFSTKNHSLLLSEATARNKDKRVLLVKMRAAFKW